MNDNVNGLVIEAPFAPEVVTARLKNIISNAAEYRTLAIGALEKYARRLYWITTTDEFLASVGPIVAAHQVGQQARATSGNGLPAGY